jgi:hypothetical protein
MYTRDQGPAVVFGSCGNEHPGTKKTKNILTPTGDYISYITTTFQPLYEGKHIIIYTFYKGKDTKKCLPCVSVT